MAATIPVYLEIGAKRVFAGALDWPGWCRSGRDEEAALGTLIDYGDRYTKAVGRSQQVPKPSGPASLRVVERLEGNATTDFGAPGIAPKHDAKRLSAAEAKRISTLLSASWSAFDDAASVAHGNELRKGPRGGGRDLEAIIRHVFEADGAYFSKLGGLSRKSSEDDDLGAAMKDLRRAMLDLLASRAKGEPAPRAPRSGSLWSPAYCVRRSAWHALDHAWEIEDRS